MSILETFHILFDSDAKEVKKGAEEAQKATDSLEKKIQGADLVATKLGKSFKSMIGLATGALAGALSIGALVSGVVHTVASADEISRSADALRIEASALQAWSEAAKRSGSSGKEFRNSLIGLNEKLTELAKTGKGEIGPLLQRLGVRFRNLNGTIKTTPQLLLDVAKSFEHLSKSESAELGKKMGLDEGTIALLQKGRLAVEDQIKRHKELGVINKLDIQAGKQYSEQLGKTKVALGDLGQVFQHMFTTVATTVLPTLSKLLKKFETVTVYLINHSSLIKGFFVGLALVLTTMYLPAVLSAAAATLALVAPYLLIGAAIAAVGTIFALAYEDVMNFFDGNDSLLGELFKRWPRLGEAVSAVTSVFAYLFEVINAGLIFIAELFVHPEKALRRFSSTSQAAFDKLLNRIPALKSAITKIGNVFNQVGSTVKSAWNGIAAAIETVISVASRGLKIISGALSQVKSFLGIGESASTQNSNTPRPDLTSANRANVMAGRQALAITSTPLSAQTSNSIMHASRSTSKSTNVQTGPITINTQASDGAAIKHELSRGLGQELSTTLNHFDDGVAA